MPVAKYPEALRPYTVPAHLERWYTSYGRAKMAENKSETTIDSYIRTLRYLALFLVWQDMPTQISKIKKEHIQAFIIWLQVDQSPSTVQLRYTHCKIFFAWLITEGELDKNPMQSMKIPKVPEQDSEMLSNDQIAALLKACEGNDFMDRRDMAMIRLMLDTGLRRFEVGSIRLEDVHMGRDSNYIKLRGKGGYLRDVPFGRKTAAALDRYLRKREAHKYADDPALWIGRQGAIRYDHIRDILDRRATRAAIPEHLHPHMFRHTFAHLWLEGEGSEEALRSIGGWRSDVMWRYARKLRGDRAKEAHKKHSPGDRF